MLGYLVARPSELLAITGFRISDVKIAKKALILPGQRCTRIDISPVNYTVEVQATSAEKLPFSLTFVFAVGPRIECPESLLKFAKLVAPKTQSMTSCVNEVVQGVIQGGTRVLAASMTVEEIFKGAKEFKREVFEKVQLELDQFGLFIYNANVKVQGEGLKEKEAKVAELAAKKAGVEAKKAGMEAKKAGVEAKKAGVEAKKVVNQFYEQKMETKAHLSCSVGLKMTQHRLVVPRADQFRVARPAHQLISEDMD